MKILTITCHDVYNTGASLQAYALMKYLQNQGHEVKIIDYKPEYLHGGHLIDRAGYNKFKEIILDGVELNKEALVAENIYWAETEYRSNINVKAISKHKSISTTRPIKDN